MLLPIELKLLNHLRLFSSKPLLLSLTNCDQIIQSESRRYFTQHQPKPSEKKNVESQPNQPLLDTFGRKHDYLRISLTEKCNLRCFYCMPAEGVQLTPSERLLSSEEVYRLASLMTRQFGVKKIRLTGGEPLVRKDIVEIVQNLSKLKLNQSLEKISITTNGIVFGRLCAALRKAGLDSVNISLDTLNGQRFQQITRRNGLPKVLRSIEAALAEDFDLVKINCVPIKNVNEDEVLDFVEMTRDARLEVRFIEYMPFDGNRWNIEKMVSQKELLETIRERYGGKLKQIPPRSPNETSIVFQVEGFAGTIGFISSMTNAFCSSCNRLRLTADGHLKVCLFGQEEVSLKDAIRNGWDDTQLTQLIVDAVRNKKKQHAGALNIAKNSNRPMILIGQQMRNFSSNSSSGQSPSLSHIDAKTGKAKMVNIGPKSITVRMARAQARIHVGPEVMRQIESNTVAKGDVFGLAKTAAIMGSKWTGNLIPLCHQIPLDSVDIEFGMDQQRQEIIVQSCVRATYRTGVEMEAMTAAMIASLTIYDMCKSINKAIVVTDCRLLEKTGGKSGHYRYEQPADNNLTG